MPPATIPTMSDRILKARNTIAQRIPAARATHQGWQIAADEDFTDYQAYNGEALDESFDGWYLRYFVSNFLGTAYSNTVQISVLHTSVSSFDVDNCGPYTWNGQTYTESGIYQHVLR